LRLKKILKRIVIGPGRAQKETVLLVKDILEKAGLEGVDVHLSTAPLR
jgi:hypothetical protein